MFADRMDAARRLAVRLSPLKGRRPLVLAIPRGAVLMADRVKGSLYVTGGEAVVPVINAEIEWSLVAGAL